jgi:iron complex outermembrane receptor protein
MRVAWLVTTCLCGAAMLSSARAQTVAVSPPGGAVENVVVSAQKRSQKVQDIPISINVLDRAKLAKLDVRRSDELAQYVPAVQIALPAGVGNQPLINIRGIGLNDTNTNNAGPNGVYVDEVYQSTPAGQTFQTFDLSRVEVLKGPQGTLYGRNTTGGAINYITAKPTDNFYASEDVQYGSFNTVSSETVINGRIAPKVDGRLAVFYDYADGFFKNLDNGKVTNGANDLAFRGQLKVEATDDLTLLFNAHGGIVNRRPDEYKQVGTLTGALFGTECGNAAILAGQCTDVYGYSAPKGFYDGRYNRDQHLYIVADGASVRADWRLGGVTLTSLTAFETSRKSHPEDTDADPYELLQIDYGVKSTDFTQEFRAAGEGEKYHWLLGLYTLNEHLKQDQRIGVLQDIDQVFNFPGLGSLAGAELARSRNGQFTDSDAAFGQADYEILPRTHLTVGGRVTYEHKSFDTFTQTAFEQADGSFPALSTAYAVQRNLANRAASWHVSLDYRLTDQLLGYATVSTGFKSGGFNGGFLDNNVANALEQLQPIKPEYITAYEAGFKSDFLGRRVRLNGAAYYYSYRDLQVYNLIQSTVPGALPLTVLTNAPTATIKGGELEMDVSPLQNLSGAVQLSYVDAVLGPFISDAGGVVTDLSGKWLPNAPRWNALLSADYQVPLPSGAAVDLSTSASWRSKQFFESNNNPLVAQGAYWLVDLRLSYTTADQRWMAALVVKNLTDEKYLNFANDLTTNFGIIEEIVGTPRYVGGELKFTY